MGKKNQQHQSSPSNTADSPTQPSNTAATPTPTTTKDTTQMSNETTTETAALAPTEQETTALAVPPTDREVLKALANRLPAKYKSDVLFLKRPSSEELFAAIEKLPSDEQDKMITLAAKTRPKKQGVHTTRSGFQPISVRIYQGTGNDPVRPQKMTPGEFYNAAGIVMGEKIEGTVIHVFEGRTLWPAKDAGGDNQSKAPICVSLDRVEGSKYGSCQACPLSTKAYNQGGCPKDVTIIFVDKELTGVYSLTFAKTSYAAGDALVKMLQKSENIWDRQVSITAQERTEKDYKWYVIKATPVSDPKNPANNYTPKNLHPIYEMLSKVVDADVYYPQLADIYDRSKNSADSNANGGGAAKGETIDESLLGTTATTEGDNPDFSKDV
jgi:hypothetical protein